MQRRSPLGPDPAATITFSGVALICTAALLGSASIDGSSLSVADVLAALIPLAIVAGYLMWVSRPAPDGATIDQIAVAILTRQADDPTVTGHDAASRAAAELLSAIDEEDKRSARERLAQIIEVGRASTSPRSTSR